jgi:putative membrane protein
MHFLAMWALLAFSFWITSKLVPGFDLVPGAWNAIVVAAIFGIVNWLLSWLLFGVLALGTLGLAFFSNFISLLVTWVVNAILLKVTDVFTSRLRIRSFGVALIGALVMSFFGHVGLYLLGHVVFHQAHPGSVYI